MCVSLLGLYRSLKFERSLYSYVLFRARSTSRCRPVEAMAIRRFAADLASCSCAAPAKGPAIVVFAIFHMSLDTKRQKETL